MKCKNTVKHISEMPFSYSHTVNCINGTLCVAHNAYIKCSAYRKFHHSNNYGFVSFNTL